MSTPLRKIENDLRFITQVGSSTYGGYTEEPYVNKKILEMDRNLGAIYPVTERADINLTDRDVDEMIEGTKIGKIIKGVRGEQPVNIDAVKSTIKSVAQMMVNHKEITECDLNPLIVTDNNEVFAVDVRIKC